MKNPFKSNDPIEISTSIIEPDSWGCLVEGYFWSVKLLLEQVIESGTFQNKWVVYPILFNIRHFYELSLKDILVNLGYIYNENFLKESHKLDDLIDIVERNGKKYFIENELHIGKKLLIKDIEYSMSVIRNEMSEFIKYDNESFAFRYPYNKKGANTIEEPMKFNAKMVYNSVLTCRNQLTKMSTQLICDDINPMLNGNE